MMRSCDDDRSAEPQKDARVPLRFDQIEQHQQTEAETPDTDGDERNPRETNSREEMYGDSDHLE